MEPFKIGKSARTELSQTQTQTEQTLLHNTIELMPCHRSLSTKRWFTGNFSQKLNRVLVWIAFFIEAPGTAPADIHTINKIDNACIHWWCVRGVAETETTCKSRCSRWVCVSIAQVYRIWIERTCLQMTSITIYFPFWFWLFSPF